MFLDSFMINLILFHFQMKTKPVSHLLIHSLDYMRQVGESLTTSFYIFLLIHDLMSQFSNLVIILCQYRACRNKQLVLDLPYLMFLAREVSWLKTYLVTRSRQLILFNNFRGPAQTKFHLIQLFI